MVRTTVLIPEALLALGALAALLAPRELVRRAAPALAPLVALAALVLELWLGGGLGSLFGGGLAVDRFALFAKAAVLLGLVVVLLAADWEQEEAPGALPFALLAALGGLVAASSTSVPALWAGLALGVLAASAGLRSAHGLVNGMALALLAGVAMAFAAAEAGTWNLAGMRVSLGASAAAGVTLPAAIVAVVALGSLAALLVLAPLGYGAGWEPEGRTGGASPSARGAAAGLGSLVAGIALARFAAALTPLWPGWSEALTVAGAGCALLGGLLALAAPGTRRRLAALAVSQAGWVVIGAAAHDRAGMAATLLAVLVLGLALAAAPVLLAELEGGAALQGLGRRHPGRGAGLLVAAGILAGLPPLGGFLADFGIGAALAGTGRLWPVGAALAGSLLGSFAVLRLGHALFLEQELEEAATAAGVRGAARGAAARGAGTQVVVSAATVGPVLVTVLLAAFTVFANPISGLAIQGAEALGLVR